MPQLQDLTGQQFGRWTVLSLSHRTEDRRYVWNCRCECGTTRAVEGGSLRRGLSVSCGCYRHDAQATHGEHQSPTYNSWSTMKQRCTNPNTPDYARYGGRGIGFAPEWETFEGFVKDMGHRPPGTTLDRRENHLGYYKSNCRWAGAHEQQNNKDTNVLVDFHGEMVSMQRIADETGILLGTLWTRYRSGKRGIALHGF